MKITITSLVLLAVLASGCRKETIVIPGNEPPLANNVPLIKIENYVNRIFIDLLGREPLDEEMDAEVASLKEAKLSANARRALIVRLQTDDSFIEGDSSYQRAYSQHVYNLAKVRCLEGASDALIYDAIDMVEDDPEAQARLEATLDSRAQFQTGQITADIMLARMVHNHIYDQINMNSFNFVQATFDNLLWRYPTQAELQAGFTMVEYQEAATLFGITGSDKTQYVSILTQSPEMFEGILIWIYRQLLSRGPTTQETLALMPDYLSHRDIRLLQQAVMITDEYANF